MKGRNILALAGLAVLANACGGGLRVSTDYDPEAGFEGYQTYKWAQRTQGGEDPRVYNELMAGRIKRAIDAALQAKGYRETSDTPDFYVAWHGAIEGRMDVQTINHHYGYGWGWYYPSGVVQDTYVRNWDEGTLMIDIVDGRSNSLVWRATGQAELDERPQAPEVQQDRLNEAAVQMLEHFPPEGN